MKKVDEILKTYANDKVLKALGKDVKEELDSLGPDELKNVVINSLESISEAAEKLAANPVYQDLRRRIDDCTEGKKEVDKYQGAKIAYARTRLREMGKLGAVDKNELEGALFAAKRALADKRRLAKAGIPNCKECNVPLRVVQVAGQPDYHECYRCETLPKAQAAPVQAIA